MLVPKYASSQLLLEHERELQRPQAIHEERDRRRDEMTAALMNLRQEERTAIEQQMAVEVRKIAEHNMVKEQVNKMVNLKCRIRNKCTSKPVNRFSQ